ncbi:MAG: phosphocholine cytidylyltransferase family protein [bacterium]
MVKKAVIVAAGLSSRLYPLTTDIPKGLLEVGSISLLQRSINILKENGIEKIAIVVGFKKNKIVSSLQNSVEYIFNPFYEHCNNMGSLWFAKDFIDNEPFVYLHGDIIYQDVIFKNSKKYFENNLNDIELVTDFDFFDEESMKVRINEKGNLIESKKEIDLAKAHGEWIGLTFVRNPKILFNYIENIMFNEGLNFYDTYAFTQMARDGFKIFCSSTEKQPWVEVDFIHDYKKAKELFG